MHQARGEKINRLVEQLNEMIDELELICEEERVSEKEKKILEVIESMSEALGSIKNDRIVAGEGEGVKSRCRSSASFWEIEKLPHK